jgi:hypothetical protein
VSGIASAAYVGYFFAVSDNVLGVDGVAFEAALRFWE